MTTEALPPAAAAAFRGLLDDPAPNVRAALLAQFKQLGEPAFAFLRELSQAEGGALAPHARHFLRELGGEDPAAAMLNFIRSYQYELETGLLLIERAVYPEATAVEIHAFLDAASARARQLLLTPASAREKCLVLNRVLFHELGFSGDGGREIDPRNSFLRQVIARRRGIPLTLSALYILVGQRCGLELELIALPGRVVVGCFLDGAPFYVDPYESGRLRSRADLREYFQRASQPFEAGALLPAPVGEILARCCRNLVNQYTAARDHKKARLFAEFVHEFELVYARHAEPT